MTHLRKLMLEELERRNYSDETTRAYVHAIKDFASYSNNLRTSWDRSMFVSIRRICCVNGGVTAGFEAF